MRRTTILKLVTCASAISTNRIAENSTYLPIGRRYSSFPTTTHDTKRSGDVRAGIDVLSEIPDEWQEHLERWSQWNAGRKRMVDGQPVPDRNEEIFLYQTLLGAWPYEKEEVESFSERIRAYAIKATREAMVHTRWTVPNLPHERSLKTFVAAILKPGNDNAFLRDFTAFQE
jgi:(1->4)-alpha-D-glucan 1-alpha-D-glucosylmutase